jgi:hypothetical protein
VIPSNKTKGYQGRKTYSLPLLGSEDSDGTNDTWYSPHCLNVAHEEAGDECVHEKLKADRFRLRCKGTSLQASNEGTQTSPRTESWLTMQAGILLWSSSELLLEVVDKDRGIACSARSGADDRAGLVAGWPKTTRREKGRAT